MKKTIYQSCCFLLLLPFTLSAQESDKRFIFSGSYMLNHSTGYNPSHSSGFNLSVSRERDVSYFTTWGVKAQAGNFYFNSTDYLDNNFPQSPDNINASSDPALLVSAGGYFKPKIYQSNDLVFNINIGFQLTYLERSDLVLSFFNSNQQRTFSTDNEYFGILEVGPDISYFNILNTFSLHLKLQYNIGPSATRARSQITLRYTSFTIGVGI